MIQFVENIKQRVGKYLWEKKYRKDRSPQMLPISQAKSVLVVYDAEQGDNYLAVRKFKEELLSRSKADVTLVGFNHHGLLQHDFISDSSSFMLSRRDFSFFYKPLNHRLVELLDAKYDMLVLLSARDLFPLVMLTRYVPALFKVGRSNVCGDLDFMIDTPNELSLGVIGNHIVTQLDMFNPKHQ